MNKSRLHQCILSELEAVFYGAAAAAQRALDTATDEENEAENKYDTMGLEASYLAHGQSKRVRECEVDFLTFKKLAVINFLPDAVISIGTLVYIEDEQDNEQIIFLSPVAGGQKIRFNHQEITLITPSSPLGKALLSALVDDEITVDIANDKKHFLITAIY